MIFFNVIFHCNGKNSFHSSFVEEVRIFYQPYFNPGLLDTAIVKKKIVVLIKQERSQKLEFYRFFKTIIQLLRVS